MTALELRYVLQTIRSARQDSELLAKSLVVYHANTPRLEATSTTEILYWADRYNDEFKDRLFLFALNANDVTIGFAQCVYFVDKNFVVIDYMTVDEKRKTVGNFLVFYEQVRAYFESIDLRYDFIVAEILQEADASYTESSEFWRTIMALERFRVVDADYSQLQLGKTKFDTQLPARLLIGANDDLSSLRRETYLMMVRTLLFDHYLRWYFPFQSTDEAAEYRSKAETVFEAVQKSLDTRERLKLSPIPGLWLPKGTSNGAYKSNSSLILFESLSYLVLLAILIWSTFALHLNASEVLLLAIGALVVRMALLSVFVPEARQSLQTSLTALQSLLGKKDSIASNRSKKSSDES